MFLESKNLENYFFKTKPIPHEILINAAQALNKRFFIELVY
jgi:hypothetical protein